MNPTDKLPTVGRIVHYTNLGDADGKYPPEQQAAIVTKSKVFEAVPEGTKEGEGKFKEVTKAYEVLSDTQKRQTYDQFGAAAFDQNGGMGGGNPFAGGGPGATTLAAGVIQSDGSVLSSLGVGSANQILKNTSGVVGWSFTGLLQLVSTSTSARIDTTASGAIIIPNDNTIPQFTEGTLILSQAITPKSATSNLIIIFSTSGTPTSAASPAIAALFVDSGANAIAAQYLGQRSSSNSISGVLYFIVSAASTTARTYQIRVGGGSLQINSGSSSRKFGGTASTFLVIAEIA